MDGAFVYGEIGPDNIIRVPYFPYPGKDAPALGDSYEMGGAGTNVAVFLAKWGVPTGLSGNVLGDDSRGRLIRSWLEAYPTLDLSFLPVVPGVRTPFCRIMVRPDGERAILYYNSDTVPMAPPSPDMLRGRKILALDLNGGDERVEMARIAREAGVLVVLGDVMHLDHPVLPYCGVIMNSMALLGHHFPGRDLRAHSRALHDACGAAVITSDGPRPVHGIDREGREFWVESLPVTPVDTTGAGDALKSGTIYGLLRGWSLPDSVRFGVAAAALNIQRPGAASHPPELGEVEAILRQL